MKKSKVVVSFSGGKDSTLALYRVIKSNYEVVGIVSTFEEDDTTCFHRIPKNILEEISKSINIPLIKVECSKDKDYEKEFEKALIHAKNLGAEYCVFGDIDIESHKQWDLDRCSKTGLKGLFPLWQEDREKLVNEFIDYKFKAMIKKVNLDYLNQDFLGKVLDKEVIEKIKLSGADPCGENGEYHTIVFDGPLFANTVNFKLKDKEVVGKSGYLDITK